MTKNWSPADLRGTKHLLADGRAIEEERIANNLGFWEPGKYKPGWTYGPVRDYEIWALGDKIRHNESPRLNPYYLALGEFETPDDRYYLPGPAAKDYSDAREGGTGRVPVRGSKYDLDEPEDFAPRAALVAYKDCDGNDDKRLATAERICAGIRFKRGGDGG